MPEIRIEWHYDIGWDDFAPVARWGDELRCTGDINPQGWRHIEVPYGDSPNYIGFLDLSAERYMRAAREARTALEERVDG